MNILFTRHGESDANLQHIISNRDLPHHLTQRGISQARALAESLRGWDVRQVFSSSIPRAQETAAIIAASLSLSFSLSHALREFDCGEMEGRGDAEAWGAHQAVTRAWDIDHDYGRRIPPDGESFYDMRDRFLPFLTGLVEQQRDSQADILLVTHGALLAHMLPLIMNNVDRAFTQNHPLGNCQLIIAHPHNQQLVCTGWAGIKLPA